MGVEEGVDEVEEDNDR